MFSLSVEQISRAFPNPSEDQGDSETQRGEYCVLGAFLLSFPTCPFTLTNAPKHIRFPMPRDAVHRALIYLGLFDRVAVWTKYRLIQQAYLIVEANDNEDFDTAWKHLDELIKNINSLYREAVRCS